MHGINHYSLLFNIPYQIHSLIYFHTLRYLKAIFLHKLMAYYQKIWSLVSNELFII
jgi:hypothetical protein